MQVAPNQISPGEPYDVFYFIRNPLDAATYYVRAVVYDVRTGDVLDTITLDQSPTNSRLFIKRVQSPSDPSGYGRNVVAIASVYTDSGYTTKSDSYEEQEQYYLIKAIAPMLGSAGIDYRGLRDLIAEVVDEGIAKLPKPPAPPDLPPMPFDALFGALGALQREINRTPKDLVDIEPILAGLSALRSTIEGRPQFEPTDLSGLSGAMQQLLAAITDARKDIKTTGTAILADQQRTAAGLSDKVLARVETGLKDLMSKQELTIPLHSLMKEKTPAPMPLDVSHLM
jgi:hypothetical protein